MEGTRTYLSDNYHSRTKYLIRHSIDINVSIETHTDKLASERIEEQGWGRGGGCFGGGIFFGGDRVWWSVYLWTN